MLLYGFLKSSTDSEIVEFVENAGIKSSDDVVDNGDAILRFLKKNNKYLRLSYTVGWCLNGAYILFLAANNYSQNADFTKKSHT